MELALQGVRVLDVSHFMAGPTAASVLADMGAEVIKVESTKRVDGWRGSSRIETDRPWEASHPFNGVNRNKYDITLDLTHPKGVAVFRTLVPLSDIVIENFTPRVMANFGLDYPRLKEINPAIIMISLSGYGATGPWRDYTAFAYPIEEMAGFPRITGYPDGPPLLMGHGGGDGPGGLMGAFAVMTALVHRQRTGKGQHIDLSQCEALTSMAGEVIMDYTMNGRVQGRRGNRHPFMAPHGCYPCKGDDKWVTLAVGTDDQWKGLCRVLDEPEWTKEERFSTPLSRWKNQDELDRFIGQWTARHDHYEVMHRLQKAGVAAGPVLNAKELLEDPHLDARGFYEVVERQVVGTHPYPGSPIRLSKTPAHIRMPAPCLGEHNEHILGTLAGLSEQEIRELEEHDVIGKRPLGM